MRRSDNRRELRSEAAWVPRGRSEGAKRGRQRHQLESIATLGACPAPSGSWIRIAPPRCPHTEGWERRRLGASLGYLERGLGISPAPPRLGCDAGALGVAFWAGPAHIVQFR